MALNVGEVRAKFNLVNPKNGQSITLDALVDTGATISVIGRDIAEVIGLKVDSKAVVYLADDSSTEMDKVNTVEIQYKDRATGNPILIGDYGIEPLMGQMVLEGLDLLVNCSRQLITFRPNSPAYTSYKLK